MKAGDDPRTDQHPNDGAPGSYPSPPDNSHPKPAPGGAGTGTERNPPSAPGGQPQPYPPSKR